LLQPRIRVTPSRAPTRAPLACAPGPTHLASRAQQRAAGRVRAGAAAEPGLAFSISLSHSLSLSLSLSLERLYLARSLVRAISFRPLGSLPSSRPLGRRAPARRRRRPRRCRRFPPRVLAARAAAAAAAMSGRAAAGAPPPPPPPPPPSTPPPAPYELPDPPRHHADPKRCLFCGVELSGRWKRCGGCHAAFFCSRDHFEAAWPAHSAACTLVQEREEAERRAGGLVLSADTERERREARAAAEAAAEKAEEDALERARVEGLDERALRRELP